MKKYLKLIVIVPIIIVVAGVSLSYFKAHTNPYKDADFSGMKVPTFSEVSFPYVNEFDPENSLPFIGSAIIDVDGDGTPEVFMGGGFNQQDMILKFDGEGFVDATDTLGKGLAKAAGDTTFGPSALDIDNDGRVDLFVARDSGVTLYMNREGGFEGSLLEIPFNEKSVPLSIALSDLNNDGFVDMFISTYIRVPFVEGQNIFNDLSYGSSSLLMMNKGDNTFTDITESAGMSYVHNTFTSVFSDVDRDGDQDLVVAYDTGQIRTWKNNGDLTFTNTDNPSSDRYGYPMGLAIGDYNNDGLMDFFFSNVSSTAPRFLAKGDIRDDQIYHSPLYLFRNDGDFTFSDTAEVALVANYEFSWGAVFDDLNNDGREDLLFSQNYVDLPFQKLFRLPGRVLLQIPDGTFGSAEKIMGLGNRKYGITPLLADFNNDGYRDVIMVNLGSASVAFINGGTENNFLKVRLPETVASLGALVEVTLPDGSKLTQQFASGEGLSSDQSHELVFGLGDALGVSKIQVFYAKGTTTVLGRQEAGQTLIFK